MTRSINNGLTLLCLIAIVLSASLAFSAVPQVISFQGRLSTASGMQLPDGFYAITCSLYTSHEGGQPLWSETQTVAVAGGNYTIQLGSETDLTLAFDVPYFLGIQVESDPEMSPRLPLSSVPYALRAAHLDITTLGFETYVDSTETLSCNPPNSPTYYRTCSRSCSCSVSGLGRYNYYESDCSVCGGFPPNCLSCYRWDATTANCSCNPPDCDPGSTPYSASCTASGENTCPQGEGYIRTISGAENAAFTGSAGTCSATSSCTADNPLCATPECSCSVTGNYDETKSCSCSSSCGNTASCTTPVASCDPATAIICGRIVGTAGS